MAAANLQALAGLQEQLEAVEERLIEVQQTLETLCKELDRDRLSSITAATEILEETARHIRRRGCMTATDWDQVAATRLTIKTQLTAARFNLADLTRDFENARSRRQRVEVLQTILKDNRLDFWLSMFVEAELAHIRSDLLTLLHEATEYPESLGDLEQRTRASIAARRGRACHRRINAARARRPRGAPVVRPLPADIALPALAAASRHRGPARRAR